MHKAQLSSSSQLIEKAGRVETRKRGSRRYKGMQGFHVLAIRVVSNGRVVRSVPKSRKQLAELV